MDSKGFFLGLIAAVVLFLLWKKEGASISLNVGGVPSPRPIGPQDTLGVGGCAGCSKPAMASPGETFLPDYVPSLSDMQIGSLGQISPGTPPLQGTLGVGSFYDSAGPTPDTTFTNKQAPQISKTSLWGSNIKYVNVPGSPTTPANMVPVRATQAVASASELGFQQRYNVAGVPRTAGARYLIN